MKILVTGGAGFIGSNFIRLLLAERPDWSILNLDKLTYAGNLANLREVEEHPRYSFVRADICDPQAVSRAVEGCDAIVNFAAESHVDRSIEDPAVFLRTNVLGVHTLAEAARKAGSRQFLQVSTDEVYGPKLEGLSREADELRPSSPYSASKAGGELLARSYWVTYCLPVLVSRGVNTIGPCQYPEKALPLFITNALEEKELPIYGDGLQVRDRLHVEDHCRALLTLLERGQPGEVYNIAAGNEMDNLSLARFVLRELGKPETLLRHVRDRPGHDRRYALDTSKLHALGWAPRYDTQAALRATINWYRENRWWWEPIKSGEFAEYYRRQYGQ